MKTEMQQCPGVETYAGETRLIPDVAKVNVFIVRDNDGIMQRVASCRYLSGNLCNRVLTDTKLAQDSNRSPIPPKCVFYEPIIPPIASEAPVDITVEQSIVKNAGGIEDIQVELPPALQSVDEQLSVVPVVKSQAEMIQEADYEIRDGVLYIKEGKRFPLFPLFKELPTDELQDGYDNEENFEVYKQPINFQGVKGEVLLTAQLEEREWVYGDAENPLGTARLAGKWEWDNDREEELLTAEEAPLVVGIQFFPTTYDDYKKVRPFETRVDCDGTEYEFRFCDDEYYSDEEDFDYRFDELKATPIDRNETEKTFLLPWSEELLAKLTGEIVRDPEFEGFEDEVVEVENEYVIPAPAAHEASFDLDPANGVEHRYRGPNLLRRFLHLTSE